MSKSTLTVVCAVALVVGSGCEMTVGRPSPRRSAPSPRPSAPTPSPAAPIEAPLSKITSPAFADDFDGKTVKFMCDWHGFYQTDSIGDPDYASIMVGGEGVSGYYVFIGIPKTQYDAAAGLKDGQKVVMTARAQMGGRHMRLFVQGFEPVP